jgi:histidinol-phosphate/aromatic aminotransferase/cobyric acid decarboxylase-like protein
LRDFSGKAGTENCLRISIGLPEENDVMLKLLGEFEAQ